MNYDTGTKVVYTLEPVCCEKQQKKFLTSYWFAEQGTKDLSDSKLIVYESK